MKRAVSPLVAAVLAGGCFAEPKQDPEPEPRPEAGVETKLEAVVDCVGMMAGTRTPISWQVAYTHAPVSGEVISETTALGQFMGSDVPKRCVLSLFEAAPGDELAIVDPYVSGQSPIIPRSGVAVMAIHYAGREHVAKAGKLFVEEVEGRGQEMSRGRGRYEAVIDVDGVEGRFTGQWEFCEYGVRRDCPYSIKGGLQKPLRISTMSVADADAEATDCRIVVDDATGAVQMDLQIDIFRGMSITQLFAGCDLEQTRGYNANRLTFRTGGWKGPGKYGPFRSTDFDWNGKKIRLPVVEWDFAMAFVDRLSFTRTESYCLWQENFVGAAAGSLSYDAYLRDGATCEYTITESPGHIELRCDDFWHYSNYFVDFAQLRTQPAPPLELSADCRVEHK